MSDRLGQRFEVNASSAGNGSSASAAPRDAAYGEAPPLMVGRYLVGTPGGRGTIGELYDGALPDTARDAVALDEQFGGGPAGGGAAAPEGVTIELVAAPTPQDRARVLGHIAALRKLTHPGVLGVNDGGPAQSSDLRLANAAYLITERRGPSLAQLLGTHGPLSTDDLRALGRDLTIGLAHLHLRGIVHGRVDPSFVYPHADAAVGGRVGRWRLAPPAVPERRRTTADDVRHLGSTLAAAAVGRASGPISPAVCPEPIRPIIARALGKTLAAAALAMDFRLGPDHADELRAVVRPPALRVRREGDSALLAWDPPVTGRALLLELDAQWAARLREQHAAAIADGHPGLWLMAESLAEHRALTPVAPDLARIALRRERHVHVAPCTVSGDVALLGPIASISWLQDVGPVRARVDSDVVRLAWDWPEEARVALVVAVEDPIAVGAAGGRRQRFAAALADAAPDPARVREGWSGDGIFRQWYSREEARSRPIEIRLSGRASALRVNVRAAVNRGTHWDYSAPGAECTLRVPPSRHHR